ncbi:hypothetical protein ATZ33_02325 [Enterococcus silesiacus]|uniref:DUF4352 domain-containing protein n=1 Tax=Enterococcus silesiacus TaxID=332949 RepID=A0A0S3K7H5_9ENTE|nr:hypothetical protein [Enterococcus silesiacus]ALS00252.1 hypothetical protein ATZ33_02325 [Enterococcus silesiacus]OJG93235.1 hypothetical protein RV15_GL001267 [Enterococcus silesiacus]
MKKKIYCFLFLSSSLLVTSCAKQDYSTEESKARKLVEEGRTFVSMQKENKREIKYTVKKEQYKENEKAVILENATPMIEISAKRAKGELYANSKNKYNYITIEFEFENRNFPEAFDMQGGEIWMVNSKNKNFKQGQGGIESKPASKGEKGYYKSSFTIGELIEIGDSITIRYNYDLEFNGGGSGPFNYIEFTVPIDSIEKEK